jgi:hypothetical protein
MKTNASEVLMGNPEGRRPVERPRCVQENYIKWDSSYELE